MKTWLFHSSQSQPPATWNKTHTIPKLIIDLLWKRGLTSLEELHVFLSPKLQHLSLPEKWYGIPKAAEILKEAIIQKQPILVWGDYDVDGVTGSTLIHDVLHFHNASVVTHLPDRKKEGYGVNSSSLKQFAQLTPGILLTVDCGISDVKAISYAKELGFTTIIADHHLPPEKLPPAEAICNPRIGHNPCPYLAGVGIAFFLMAALNSLLEKITGKRMDMRKVLDLVALGTLADMAQITGENRILVKNGLLKIAEGNRPGIAALKGISGFSQSSPLTARQVVFSLAPKINAAGRLSNPRIAYEMLSTNSIEKAVEHANILNTMNTERRSEEERITSEALVQAEKMFHKQGLVLYGKDWHQGVIGIVASRVTETLHKPTIILCSDGDFIKGSGRSVADFDLHEGLCQCADMLVTFGGHKQAVGVKLLPQNLEKFQKTFDSIVRNFFKNEPIQPCIHIDMELSFSQTTNFHFLKSLEQLQPFGIGNPEPIFASLPLKIKQNKLFGSNKEHIIMTVIEESSGITLQAKGWKLAKTIPPINSKIQLAYTIGINTYKGIASIEITIKDWRLL